jgi:wobble nucleotide-excising tRNase
MGDSKGNSLGKIKKITSLKIDNYVDKFNYDKDFHENFNIIYGLNGSGKTSLSRLIGSFSTKYREQDSNNSVDNKSITGAIIVCDGVNEDEEIKNDDLDKKFENIFIFNSDYIQNNIAASKQDGGKLQDYDNDNSIILGEEEIKQNEEIQKNEKEIEELNNELKNIIGCAEENIKGSLNTKISAKKDAYELKKLIIEKFRNSVTSDNPILNNNKFNVNTAEEFLKKEIKKPATTLNANDIKTYKQKINDLAKSKYFTSIVKINGPEQVITNYQNLFVKLKKILDSKKITSKEEIQRFTDNPSLNRWARDIFDEIKNQKLSDSKCPICASEKIITDDKEVSSFKEFYDEKLTAYFNEEKQKFNTECKALKGSFNNTETLDTIVSGVPTYTKFLTDESARQYINNRDNIDEKIKLIKILFNQKVIEIIVKKEDSCVKNDEKYTNDYENLSTEFNNNFKDVKELINNINQLIESNNRDLEIADKRTQELGEDIKTSYYFNNYKEDYDNVVKTCKKAEEEFIEENKKQTEKENEIETKKNNIETIKEDVKKQKIADNNSNFLNTMNTYLKATALQINIDYSNNKIILKRDNNTIPLHKLSEGEKNLLLFTYFIVRIKIYTEDKEGDSEKNAIVVIDDPHSSLDENYVYNIYKLIEKLAVKTKEDKKEDKKKYKNNIQVFLLSHNSYFLCNINTSMFRNRHLKKEDFEIFKNANIKTITLKQKKNRFQNLGVDYINKYKTLCEVSKLGDSDNSNLIGSAKPREFLEEMQTYLLPSYDRLEIEDKILKYINIKQNINILEHYNDLNASRQIEIALGIFNDLKNIDIDKGTDEDKKVKSYIQQHINLLDKAIGNNNN